MFPTKVIHSVKTRELVFEKMFVYASYEGRLLRRRGAETGKLDSI